MAPTTSWPRCCRPAGCMLGTSPSLVGRRPDDRHRGRDADRRVHEPIDDALRSGHGRAGAAPRAGRPAHPAKHCLPGHDGACPSALGGRGADVRLAFCPERIAEGHALEELGSLPRSSGPTTGHMSQRAAPCSSASGPRPSPTTAAEAELAKLFTNAWRYMKFAVANQFFMIANDAGQDYERILEAIRRDYPRASDLPGPGFAAGPCLLEGHDAAGRVHAGHFPMGQSARQINEGLPAYLVSAMVRRWGDLTGRRVGILGHGVQGGIGRHTRLAQLQAPQAARVGGRGGALHGPVRRRRATPPARGRPRAVRDPRRGCPAPPVPRDGAPGQAPRRRLGRQPQGITV